MKKEIAFFCLRRYVALLLRSTPVVGLWEQVIAGDRGDGSPVGTQRIDVVFVDKKISEDTRFSGLFSADIKPEILCCIDIKKVI